MQRQSGYGSRVHSSYGIICCAGKERRLCPQGLYIDARN